LLADLLLEHLDLVLEHFNVVFVVGRFISHLLLVFGNHLSEASLRTVLLFVEALF
jgi:hypothetical protein